MKIILDVRERGLYERMTEKMIELQLREPDKIILLESKVLELGDVILQTNDDTDILLIERKTIADLFASIKDGRYEEQSHRIIHSSNFNTHNVMYILEGSINNLKPSEKKLFYSCITSLNILKGFSVIRTGGIQETSDIIFAIADKLERDFKKGKVLAFKNKTTLQLGDVDLGRTEEQETGTILHQPSLDSYTSVVKKVKKDNITPENIGEIMLCQIPGISSKFAIAIMKKFGTIQNLLNEMNRTGQEVDCFDNILVESNGKQRKINKTCGESIRKFLIPSIEKAV